MKKIKEIIIKIRADLIELENLIEQKLFCQHDWTKIEGHPDYTYQCYKCGSFTNYLTK